MFCGTRTRLVAFALAFMFALVCAQAVVVAQDDFEDDAADPVKLFNKGQDAHSKKNYEQAIELYDEALKLRPDFAEVEFQKAGALLALKRTAEAEKSYRRASEMKPTWSLPPAALGLLLARTPGREREAEAPLRRALELDAKNLTATIALAELRTRSGDAAESLSLWRRATELKPEDASLWVERGRAERAAKDAPAALKSFARALELDAPNVEARLARADLYLESNDKEHALEDVRALEAQPKAASDWKLAVAVANRYGLAGMREDAKRVYESLPEEVKNSEEGKLLSAAVNDVRCEDTPESRASLEKLIASDEKNAAALACLGSLLRTSDPQRSAELFQRANQIDPSNADYAVGYGAALVQLRQFERAASILQRVVRLAPEHYEAHANFAAALYEMKLYKQAVSEYKWLSQARPGLAIVHFFIGTAHDRLGEYEDALAAYETFLAAADPTVNRLEMDKVNLRLPSLRNQIKRGEGVKSDGKTQ
ncbi:MAG TPA: tetratricopeptide repeat protein [Pyrinomonadaceae bacterium]|nr:tetratricopeptide repeat protein [Pyrinomonadaceae bacterium]